MADTIGHGARRERLAEFRTGRRALLQTLGAALIASALLPGRIAGQGPSVTSIQATSRLKTGDLQATLTWDAANTDMDLFLIEPTGDVVAWCSRNGPTALLDVDNTAGFGPESIYVPARAAANGVYQIYVGYYQGAGPVTATLRLTAFDGAPHSQQRTFTRDLPASDYNETLCAVARIEFPSGRVVEQHGHLADPVPVPDCARACSK